MKEKLNLRNEPRAPRRACTSQTKSGSVVLPLLVSLAITSGVCWWSNRSLNEPHGITPPSEAAYQTGKRAFYSAHSPADYATAVRLIRKAAEEGNARAQTALAVLYTKGLGVHQEQQAAVGWLRKAALQNFADAQNQLGILYATGKGVPQNLGEAILWCRKAALQGNVAARKNLALLEAAQTNSATSLSTPNGKTYRNATLEKVTFDGMLIAFEPENGGVGLAKLKGPGSLNPFEKLCGLTTEPSSSSLSAWLQQKFSQVF